MTLILSLDIARPGRHPAGTVKSLTRTRDGTADIPIGVALVLLRAEQSENLSDGAETKAG
jgi:hypothetical protein